jgi:CDP-4-dehydro-6-deoxyglucose reductase
MAHWVTVWRAAQLVGVSRGVLQQRVRAGEIELADGLVSTDRLLELYPQAQIEGTGMLERVVQIRDEAFARRLRERVLPSQEVLAQRLFRQGQELADVQRMMQRYHALVLDVRKGIEAAREGASAAEQARLSALIGQLNDGLARVLATESVDVLDVMDDVMKVMNAQVTVRPSGNQFVVEGHDSLLQAGMRAGLKLNYGCGNGTCGMCKVRVTSGEVVRTMHADYVLSDAERSQGYVLACAHSAASSELTIETLEARGPQDIPLQQITATVRAVKPLAPDTWLLHLQTPRTHRLRFLAGQWVTLGLPDAAASQAEGGVRSDHAIASCPCDDRNLHFYIPRDEGDPLAVRLFAGGVKPGDAVTVWGPGGRFVLEDTNHKPLVFACCDTGFAPVKSLVEHALSLDSAPSIHLYWLATRPDGHFMSNQCRAWSEAIDQLECSLITDTEAGPGAARTAQAIRQDLFDVDCGFYVAGPRAFVQTLTAELASTGVPAAQVLVEVTDGAA